MKLKIALLPGDGIGPEIMRQGLAVLNAIAEKYGHELLNEVLEGGNFGHSSDEHAKQKVDDEGKETFASKVEGNFATIKRGMKLFWSYPSECFWVPYLCLRASWVRNYWRKVEVPSSHYGEGVS